MQRTFEDVLAAGGIDCVSQETYRKAQGLRRNAKPSCAGKQYPHRNAFHSLYVLLSLQALPFGVFPNPLGSAAFMQGATKGIGLP